ncbi:hypothetical protein SO694_00180011 [Aureococcus anophagefferens]|uniref:Sulfotransferase domain-containing protein n=1 Tax=Aureococcus anophagefferens TaxID=44056 RepID=A0ABR1FGE3_AURAN
MSGGGPLTQKRAWAAAPALCNGTAGQPPPMLVFVHIFKSAGSTTRATLKACGARAGGSGKLCTRNGRPQPIGSSLDVVAGHVWYNTFQTPRPTIYVTCLRDPLNLRISALLYTGNAKYKKMALTAAAADVAASLLKKAASEPIYDNVLKRVGAPGPKNSFHGPISADVARAAAARATRALDETFAIVGLTERYTLFYAQLAALLPAAGGDFWAAELKRHENPAPHSTAAVRARVGMAALQAANATLAWEYAVYGAAVGIHDARCRAHLGADVCAGRTPAFPFLAA